MDCTFCYGNGEMECPHCSNETGGTENHECPACNGLEIIPCRRCFGTGYLEQYAG